jgi:hypothetical protein
MGVLRRWPHSVSCEYEGVSKSFRTGRMERELQMVQLFVTMCSCIAILWVRLVSFGAITLSAVSQPVFTVVIVYFVIEWVRKLLDTTSCTGVRLAIKSFQDRHNHIMHKQCKINIPIADGGQGACYTFIPKTGCSWPKHHIVKTSNGRGSKLHAFQPSVRDGRWVVTFRLRRFVSMWTANNVTTGV